MTGTIKKGDMKMGKEMREELNLNAIDRSMTSLRTLRFPEDEDIFWFRDDLHQPYPISPLGMTTIQKHHAWGYHVAADKTKLPPSKGAHVKIYKGRVFLGFEVIKDGDEIETRFVEIFPIKIGLSMDGQHLLMDEGFSRFEQV